jgi:hypothetical protein
MQNTTQAPYSKLYRTVVANDVLPVTDKKQGLNCGQYNRLSVEVIPSGGDNPTVAVLIWSEEAGAFIALNPAFTKAGVGVDTPYAFTFDCDGRIVFIAVTAGGGAGETKIATSGFDMSEGTG